jgi:hypothetical protein
MRLLHSASRTHASFDDPNLVSCAGLVPVMRLAQSCGLHTLLAGLVHLGTSVGCNLAGKITSIEDHLDRGGHGHRRGLYR